MECDTLVEDVVAAHNLGKQSIEDDLVSFLKGLDDAHHPFQLVWVAKGFRKFRVVVVDEFLVE